MKNNLRNLLICALAMVLVFFCSVVSPSLALSSSQIEFTMLRYEPMPAEPGKYVNVFVKIENTGNTQTDDINIEFIDNYPFKLADEGDRVKNIGSLGIDKEKSIVIEYRVIVDNNAVEGTNEMKLSYFQGDDSGLVIEEVFNVDVVTSTKVITISDVKSNPVYAAPGETVVVTLDVENLESSNLYDLSVSLDFSDTTIPFSPFQSVPEKHMDMIDGKGLQSVDFSLIVNPAAESGIYKIPVTISYEDKSGTAVETSYTISLVVRADPSYKIDIKDSPLIIAGDRGAVILSFSNTGSSEIKYLNFELLETDDYKLISVPSDYLGNLESYDFETTEFEIKVSSSFSGKSLPLNVRVSYADSFNEVLEDTLTVDMKMYSADELAELGIKSTAQEETSLTLLLLVAPIGILVLSFWLFMLVDACTARFKKKTFKVMWVVLLLVTHIFGAIVYFFVRNRFKVLEE